jgi:hypothetical protein
MMKAQGQIRARELGYIEQETPLDAFSSCIERVESVIRSEMEILKKGGKIDFDALNQKKSHALLELLRVMKGAPARSSPQAAQRVKNLQRLLSDNAELLARRLQATEELTSLIVRHIRDSESDGTYSIRSPRARQR